jgi:hypothetical protein
MHTDGLGFAVFSLDRPSPPRHSGLIAVAHRRHDMTVQADAEDERREQLLAESVALPDIRLPLATVEPVQRGDRAPEATGAGGVLAELDPVPYGLRR